MRDLRRPLSPQIAQHGRAFSLIEVMVVVVVAGIVVGVAAPSLTRMVQSYRQRQSLAELDVKFQETRALALRTRTLQHIYLQTNHSLGTGILMTVTPGEPGSMLVSASSDPEVAGGCAPQATGGAQTFLPGLRMGFSSTLNLCFTPRAGLLFDDWDADHFLDIPMVWDDSVMPNSSFDIGLETNLATLKVDDLGLKMWTGTETSQLPKAEGIANVKMPVAKLVAKMKGGNTALRE